MLAVAYRMQSRPIRLLKHPKCLTPRQYSFVASPRNLIQIQDGTFYREHPSSISGSNKTRNPPLFPNLSFALSATPTSEVGTPSRKTSHWAVIGANDTATFLDALRGSLLCLPPTARTYPYLSSDEIKRKDPRLSLPSRAIQYVGFNAKNAGPGAGAAGVQGAYLSARYESRREETDWTVLQYLKGDTELNASEVLRERIANDDPLLLRVIQDLKLEKLLHMPVSNLSNGQTRRSRIAKALMSKPELLLLDEPFMGLDPPTLVRLSPMLRELAWRSSPLLVLALRPQDPIPDWIDHLIVLGARQDVVAMGEKDHVLFSLKRWSDLHSRGGLDENGKRWLSLMSESYGEPLMSIGDSLTETGIKSYDAYDMIIQQEKKYFDGSLVRQRSLKLDKQKLWELSKGKSTEERSLQDWSTLITSMPSDLGSDIDPSASRDTPVLSHKQGTPSKVNLLSLSTSHEDEGEPLIELQDLVLKYGDKTILGHPPPQSGFDSPGLNLTIRRGTRLALLGPNGSGKTTLLSLLTSDHPQSYSLPLKFFGRTRLPEKGKPGLSFWEIQSQIGHSSPEVHAFFPKRFTIRQTLESSWAETFSSRPEMTPERSAIVTAVLKWWKNELKPSALNYQNSSSNDSDASNTEDISWSEDNSHTFATLPFSVQRLLLLLRALIKQPSIIILDEAFSGLSPSVRDKAMAFLHDGIPANTAAFEQSFSPSSSTSSSTEKSTQLVPGIQPSQAMIIVSHLREEIPESINEWIRLPSEEEAIELGKSVEMGKIGMDIETDSTSNSTSTSTSGEPNGNQNRNKSMGIRDINGWNRVWGL